MGIYWSKGFGALLYPYKGELDPFEFIAQAPPMVVPKGITIDTYKSTTALYCLSGEVTPDKNYTYRRSNDNLVSRDLIFLDYDAIEPHQDFIKIVAEALYGYSYIIYPTIKHTKENPRYRLVIKPSHSMQESTYKAVVKEIADKIGLPFDLASLTWSQLQGLPVTTGNKEDYQKIVNRGRDYPTPNDRSHHNHNPKTTYKPRTEGQRSITMKVIDTLFNGFGDEGGRNNAVARFVGLLFNKWVDCDLETAYELTLIANNVTNNPLPIEEVDRTFKSIARAEFRKRG